MRRMRKIRKEIPYGERLPRGYGIAYHRVDADFRVAYPIPINVFVSIGRDIYFIFARPFSFMDEILKRQYAKGWRHGYEAGLADGKRTLQQVIAVMYKGGADEL